LILDKVFEVRKFCVILPYISSTGSRPQESKGSVIRIELALKPSGKASDVTGTWLAEVKKIDGKNLECGITSAPDSSVGKYQFFVETSLVDEKESMKRHLGKEAFNILFNAWIKGFNWHSVCLQYHTVIFLWLPFCVHFTLHVFLLKTVNTKKIQNHIH
jgi:hypothetical protein